MELQFSLCDHFSVGKPNTCFQVVLSEDAEDLAAAVADLPGLVVADLRERLAWSGLEELRDRRWRKGTFPCGSLRARRDYYRQGHHRCRHHNYRIIIIIIISAISDANFSNASYHHSSCTVAFVITPTTAVAVITVTNATVTIIIFDSHHHHNHHATTSD